MRDTVSIREIPLRAVLAASGLVLACLVSACGVAMGEKETPQPGIENRPNVILILTDDLDTASMSRMPNVRSLLVEQGTTFENAFVTDPLCCPSRATILRGQYAHNHGILSNDPPQGGSMKFRLLGHERSTVATWLDEEGYRTAFIGKYLNGYGFGESETEYVPPGWDEWHGLAGNYLSDRINENGEIKNYGPGGRNSTDVFSEKAARYIRSVTGKDAGPSGSKPFLMWLGTKDPHDPADPADRHEGAFAGEKLPRPPSFDEKDVSDKPAWVRDNPPLDSDEVSDMQDLYRNRLESLLAVDDMIGRLVGELREAGELDDTYIVFTSDNGHHLGEHRLGPGKWTPYEEDIRVPLVVRGPGVPAGRKLDHLVLNNDLAPSIADLAGAETPDFVDGRSLTPLLEEDPPSPQDWRRAFLIEGASDAVRDPKARWSPLTGDRAPDDAPRTWGRPGFEAIRTRDRLYVEYETGERELYDLRRDLHQLENVYQNAGPRLLQNLAERLDRLRDCYGSFCKTAENSGKEGGGETSVSDFSD